MATTFSVGLVVGFFGIPMIVSVARLLGWVAIVEEQTHLVFTLFGRVIGGLTTPGLHFPPAKFGLRALLVPFFGKTHKVEMGLRHSYLRSQMVNSEEGTPMGVGIWYEMAVGNPVDYLFKNASPEESLRANVANATVSTLSNLEMAKMLEDRHSLSRSVRETVSPLSEKWGYRLGSIHIRKVAFTDAGMVQDITSKVVKRLTQVTSAMKQDGENRVGLIRSETAKKVSQEMAQAQAMRPEVVGSVLNAIGGKDKEVLETVIEVLETEKLLSTKAQLDFVPSGSSVLIQLNAAESSTCDDDCR